MLVLTKGVIYWYTASAIIHGGRMRIHGAFDGCKSSPGSHFCNGFLTDPTPCRQGVGEKYIVAKMTAPYASQSEAEPGLGGALHKNTCYNFLTGRSIPAVHGLWESVDRVQFSAPRLKMLSFTFVRDAIFSYKIKILRNKAGVVQW